MIHLAFGALHLGARAIHPVLTGLEPLGHVVDAHHRISRHEHGTAITVNCPDEFTGLSRPTGMVTRAAPHHPVAFPVVHDEGDIAVTILLQQKFREFIHLLFIGLGGGVCRPDARSVHTQRKGGKGHIEGLCPVGMLCQLFQRNILRDVPIRIVRISASVLTEPDLEDPIAEFVHLLPAFDEIGILREKIFPGDVRGTEPVFDVLWDGRAAQGLAGLDPGQDLCIRVGLCL